MKPPLYIFTQSRTGPSPKEVSGFLERQGASCDNAVHNICND